MKEKYIEMFIVGWFGLNACLLLALLFFPSLFRPLLDIPAGKSLSAIGIFFNLIGGVFLAVDVLTSDNFFFKTHRGILDVFFMSLFIVPTYYLIIVVAVTGSGVALIGAFFTFLFCGALISVWGDVFHEVILTKLGQQRAIGGLGVVLLVVGFSLQLSGVVAQ